MEGMTLFDWILRRISPKRYIMRGIKRDTKRHEENLKDATLSQSQKQNVIDEFYQCTMREWNEWLLSIEQAEMIARAKKMDVFLEDIPLPEFDESDMHAIRNSHYYYGMFGERLLCAESHKLLREAVKERRPIYRQECHARYQLWINFGLLLAGLLGAATGLATVLR